VKPHRKPKRKSLTPAQQRENDMFSEFRGDIERKFGEQVTRFAIIRLPFRHGELRFNSEFKIGIYI